MAREQLDIQGMLGIKAEPKRKYRWIMNIDRIDIFMFLTAARPQVTISETVVPYMNIKRKYAGKPEWATLPITLIDYISPSATQRIWEKMRMIYDPATGLMGYPEIYQEDMTLKMLSPVGEVVEKWILKDAWFSDVNWNELDYNTEEPANIAISISYNWAINEF